MSEPTWQKITHENQPKAPCFLGRADESGTPVEFANFYNLAAILSMPKKWTHFLPVEWPPFPQPEKHPAELAFEEWWKSKGYDAEPGNWPVTGNSFKAGAKWAFKWAAENLCEPFREEMRERLNNAAECTK